MALGVNMQARAVELRADKYADPWLKLARYEELTDDLLDRLDEAVNYLNRVVQADREDTKMGYPIPGDSCLAACIGLEVMRFLDEVGALTERSVADAIGSTSGGIPAQVGTGRSVSSSDIDALEQQVENGLRWLEETSHGDRGHALMSVHDPDAEGGWTDEHAKGCKPCAAHAALSSLVAIAKDAENQRDYWIECDEYSRERAEAAEARVAELEANALVAVSWLDQKLNFARAAFANPDTKEGTS